MKTEEELKEWFWDMYNSCYIFKCDDYSKADYLFYDENFIRQVKLKTILGEEIIYPTKPTGKWLFQINHIPKYFFINNELIWSVINTEYGHCYENTVKIIQNWLHEHKDLKRYLPIISSTTTLSNVNNFKIIKPK